MLSQPSSLLARPRLGPRRSRGWWARLSVLLLTAGCAAPPPAKPPSIEVAAAPERDTDPSADVEHLAPPRAAAGCIVTETEIDGFIELRFELGGAPLALLRDAEARLALDGEPRFVELERGGVMLRTPFDPQERPLHLRQAVALGGVVTPKPHSEIVALDRTAGGQRVRYTTGSVLGHAVIEDAVSCAHISLNTQAYEVQAATEPEGKPVQLIGKVAVRKTPGAAPTLELGAKDILADELERRAGFVKIRVETYEELLLGWVPEGAIGVVTMGHGGGGSGSGMGFGSGSGRFHVRYKVCPRELTLFAELEGRVGEVGLVRPDTPFELGERIERGAQAGFSVVNFWQAWMQPRSSVRLLLPTADLGGCVAAP